MYLLTPCILLFNETINLYAPKCPSFSEMLPHETLSSFALWPAAAGYPFSQHSPSQFRHSKPNEIQSNPLPKIFKKIKCGICGVNFNRKNSWNKGKTSIMRILHSVSKTKPVHSDFTVIVGVNIQK